MFKNIFALSAILFFVLTAPSFSQLTMSPTADAYDAPYDSLVQMGRKALAGAQFLGKRSAQLSMMFFNRAIEVNPDEAAAYAARGDAYIIMEDWDNAEKDFTKALDFVPDYVPSVKGLYDVILKKAGNYSIKEVPKAMAYEVFNRAQAFIKIAPDSLSGAKSQAATNGALYKLQADSPEAMKMYFDAMNSDSATAIGHFEKALPIVEKSENPVALALVAQGLGKKYYMMKEYEKAKGALQKAIATKECDGISYSTLARILYDQEKKGKDAEKLCLDGLKRLKTDRDISNFLMHYYYRNSKELFEKKKYAEVVKELEKYQEYNMFAPRPAGFLAYAYFHTKKYDKALQQFRLTKTLSDSLEFIFLHPQADQLMKFAEKPGKKVPAATNRMLENEKYEELSDKSFALIREKKYDDAIASYQPVQAYYEKENYSKGRSATYYGIAAAYHYKNDLPKAKEFYQKSIDVGAASPMSYSNIAHIYFYGEKNEPEGERAIADGLQKFPDDQSLKSRIAEYYESKAFEEYEKKDFPAAISWFEKSLKYEEDAENYVFLGFSLYQSQKVSEAKEKLEKAKEMNPNIVKKYPAIDKVLNQ